MDIENSIQVSMIENNVGEYFVHRLLQHNQYDHHRSDWYWNMRILVALLQMQDTEMDEIGYNWKEQSKIGLWNCE